jgi:hypothetical protein
MRLSMKKVISLLLLVVCLVIPAVAKEKPKVAVVDFKEVNCMVPNVGPYAANKVNDAAVALGSISVIDRANLQQILQEQNIGLSGILDAQGNYQVGKISGVDYLIVGEVSQGLVTKNLEERSYREKKSDGTYINRNKKIWIYKGTANVQVRVINVTTGQIIYSATKQGSAQVEEEYVEPQSKHPVTAIMEALTKSTPAPVIEKDPNVEKPDLVGRSIDQAVPGFGYDFFNIFKPEGYLIAIDPYKKNYTVTIDLGKNFGVKKNDIFEVIEKGAPIRHPVTGDILPGKIVAIDKIKITEVSEETSTAYVKRKIADKLKTGMSVRTVKRGGCM